MSKLTHEDFVILYTDASRDRAISQRMQAGDSADYRSMLAREQQRDRNYHAVLSGHPDYRLAPAALVQS